MITRGTPHFMIHPLKHLRYQVSFHQLLHDSTSRIIITDLKNNWLTSLVTKSPFLMFFVTLQKVSPITG